MIRQAAGIGAGMRSLLLAMAVAFAACSKREEPKVEENLFPANYKTEIINVMPSVVADATNIRGAFVSEPALTPIGAAPRYTVCVRFNPRSANRQYAGSQDRIAIFYAGRLNQFILASAEQCGKAAYKPFPELEKICYGQRCD
jgi:hypothetical protein